jgi:hypothetical protein
MGNKQGDSYSRPYKGYEDKLTILQRPCKNSGFPKCRCAMQSCIEMHEHPRSLTNVSSNLSLYSVTFVISNTHMVVYYGVEVE